MKNFKKIFATVMGTICSVSFSNFANAWGHQGITDDQIRQLQAEFDKVWNTLEPGTDEKPDLPEDQIMEAARNGKIDLNCVVRAKVLKDILVKWDIMATTGTDHDHVFILLLRDDGEPLALNFFDDENDKPTMSIDPLSSYLIAQEQMMPVFDDNIVCAKRNYGFSLGVWLRLMKLQIEKERQDITKGHDVALEKLENGLKKYIKKFEEKGNLFVQPAVNVKKFPDKTYGTVLLPTEFDQDTLFLLDSYLKDNCENYEGYLGNYRKVPSYIELSKKLPKKSYKIIKFKMFDEETDELKAKKYLGHKRWFDKKLLNKNELVLKYGGTLRKSKLIGIK